MMKTIDVNNIKHINIDKYHRKRLITLLYKKSIKTKDMKKYINNYNYLKTFLHFNENSFIYEIDPKELLSPINYDIFIKYLYLKNINNKLYKKIYINHIKAFNNYKEPDGSKNCKKDFLNACNNFIKNNDYSNTIIPISKQGIIIDGSHRVAISIIKNQKILCTDFDVDDLFFDFHFFIDRGFKKRYCEYIGFIIIDLVKNISYIKINYINKKQYEKELNKIIHKYDVYYIIKKKKEIFFLIELSENEMKNNINNFVINKKYIKNEYSKFIKKSILKKCKELNIC